MLPCSFKCGTWKQNYMGYGFEFGNKCQAALKIKLFGLEVLLIFFLFYYSDEIKIPHNEQMTVWDNAVNAQLI